MEISNKQTLDPISVNPDTEPKIIIDADLRTITVPGELVNIGVVGDHYAETVYFDCPRYFDGIDLSNKTCEIRFVNAAGYEGISRAIDITPEGESMTFGWEIDKRVTLKSGKVKFAVFFTSSDNRGYQYSTQETTVNVLKGLEEGLEHVNQDNTLLLQLQHQLTDIANKLEVVSSDVNNLQKKNIDTNNTINLLEGNIQNIKDDIIFLKDNVIYTSNISS